MTPCNTSMLVFVELCCLIKINLVVVKAEVIERPKKDEAILTDVVTAEVI